MSNTAHIQHRDYGQSLYVLPFLLFYLLITLRNSDAYGHIFELLPVLGRTMPFFFLTVSLVAVFKCRGGTLKQLGLAWPQNDKAKFKMVIWLVAGAIVVLAMRIFIAFALEPLLEFLPPKISRSNELAGNLTLLMGLLPMMWLIVIYVDIKSN